MNSTIFSQINWLAVLVSAIAYFALGAIWYSKAVFGPRWATAVGLNMNDPEKVKGMAKMLTASLVLTIITCTGLALLVTRLDINMIVSAIKLGLVTGLGFAATAVAISFIYESRKAVLYFIDCGYHLAGHIIATLIIVLWR